MSIIAYKHYLENRDPYFNKNYSLNSNKLEVMNDSYPLYQEFLDKYHQEKLDYYNGVTKVISKYQQQISTGMLDNEVLIYDISPLELEKKSGING